MATIKQTLTVAMSMLDGLEQDLFDNGENTIYYNGLKITRKDWRSGVKLIKNSLDVYNNRINSARKFLKENPGYNRTMRMICYYRGKPNKSEKDYAKLEKLLDKLDEINKANKEKQSIENKIKNVKKEVREEIRDRVRSIDDEFR